MNDNTERDDIWVEVLSGAEVPLAEDDGYDARHARALRTAIAMTEDDDMDHTAQIKPGDDAEQSWQRMRGRLAREGLIDDESKPAATQQKRFAPFAIAAVLVLGIAVVLTQNTPVPDSQPPVLGDQSGSTLKGSVIPQIVYVEGAAQSAAARFAEQLRAIGLSAELVSDDEHHYVRALLNGGADAAVELLDALGLQLPDGDRLVVDFMSKEE